MTESSQAQNVNSANVGSPGLAVPETAFIDDMERRSVKREQGKKRDASDRVLGLKVEGQRLAVGLHCVREVQIGSGTSFIHGERQRTVTV